MGLVTSAHANAVDTPVSHAFLQALLQPTAWISARKVRLTSIELSRTCHMKVDSSTQPHLGGLP
jgi:hypothetical protein